MDNLITPQMKLNRLFRAYPELLETMIAQSAQFQRLRNPLLRRTLTPLTTIEQAARIGGLDVAQLILTLRRAANQPVIEGNDSPAQDSPPPAPCDAPDWLESAVVATTLDVRRLQDGGAPLPPILAAARDVQPGQQLIIQSAFEPLPLYAVLEKQGFENWAVVDEESQWTIHFFKARDGQARASDAVPAEAPAPTAGRVAAAKLDVRELPPPEPMQQILAALGDLEAGQWLYVHHARRPVHLLPLLEQQGHHFSSDARPDGSVDFWVRKGGAQ